MKYFLFNTYGFCTACNSIDEALEKAKEISECVGEPDIVSEKKFFKGCNTIYEKIAKTLDVADVYEYEYDEEKHLLSVEITGDFRHSHEYADDVVKNMLSGEVLSEIVTSENGSDWYTSNHFYKIA